MWASPAAFFRREAAVDGPPCDARSLRFLPPSPHPEKIVCVGLNYRAHAEEAGQEIPRHPVLFAKFANSLVGHDATVMIPPETAAVDYEAELAVVIGEQCSHVSVADALNHVAGYCCANDLSAHDLPFLSTQCTVKAIDGFLPLGP